MRNRRAKKSQHVINKAVRDMNINIMNDDLWKGRFYAHQIKSYYYDFEDGSGTMFYALIEFVDRADGTTYCKWFEHWNSRYKNFLYSELFWAMNYFITEVSQVWNGPERPTIENAVDYRKEWY